MGSLHTFFLSEVIGRSANIQCSYHTPKGRHASACLPFYHRSPSFLSVSLRISARRSLRYSEKATLSSP